MNQYHPAENRQVGDIVVQRVQMLPSTNPPTFKYEAWEPSWYTGPHHTVTTINGQTYGAVTSRRPEGHEELVDEKRVQFVREWYNSRQALALKLIGIAFPETSEGMRVNGQIYLQQVIA